MMDDKLKKTEERIGREIKSKDDLKPKYASPEIITYSGDDILKELGTAKACSPFPP